MKHLYNGPSNWFTGSIYHDRLCNPWSLSQWFASKGVSEVYFQLERGRKGNLHWQYTIRIPGDQERYSFWWKKWDFVAGEWIDGCKAKGACMSYCKKSDTRVDGPFRWLMNGRVKPEFKLEKPNKKFEKKLLLWYLAKQEWSMDYYNWHVKSQFCSKVEKLVNSVWERAEEQ